MSYLTILTVINEHTGSTVAARYAITMAASCKARLVLYCAYMEGGDTTQSERHLEHLFNEATKLKIPVTLISEIGNIKGLLPVRAKAEGADLVFYPLTPGERYGSPLQRQTVYHLLRTIKSDLAIMRIMHLGRPHPRRILMPLGGVVSDIMGRVKFIAAVAKSFNSQITLFHRPNSGHLKFPDDLLQLQNELRLQHLNVLERRGSGRIDRAIAMEAVSHHNDLIVLGASERGILRRLFFGNPAGDVMHQPPCNTVLFRPGRQLS